MRVTYPVTARWIYIYTVYGCSIISTNDNLRFDIPSGFFAVNRDEIENYFSNNYISLDVVDEDTSFSFFCYDFAINSVQPLSDSVTPLILSEMSAVKSYVISLENLSRIIQNNTSICSNVLQQFYTLYSELNSKPSVVDLGSVIASESDGSFIVYIPKGLKAFNGTLLIDYDVSDYAVHSISGSSGSFSFPDLGLEVGFSYSYMSYTFSILSVSEFTRSFPVKILATDGSSYNCNFGNVISSYSFYGSVGVQRSSFYAASLDSFSGSGDFSTLYAVSLDSSKNLNISLGPGAPLFKIANGSFVGANSNNWGCKFHFEIPFSYSE